MQNKIPLLEASICLYDLLMNHIKDDVYVRVSVDNQTISIHDTDCRQLLCSFDHAEISSHMQLFEQRGVQLEKISFPADDIRRLLNSHQDIANYFEKDALYLEATIEHYIQRMSRLNPYFASYFTVKFVKQANCHMLCMYDERAGAAVIPDQSMVSREYFWAHFTKVQSYTYLTPESFARFRAHFGTKLMTYYSGIFMNAVRIAKLKLLIQP